MICEIWHFSDQYRDNDHACQLISITTFGLVMEFDFTSIKNIQVIHIDWQKKLLFHLAVQAPAFY